jgi:hypothetical protein
MNTIWLPDTLGGQIGKLEYSRYVPFGGYRDAITTKLGQMNSYKSSSVAGGRHNDFYLSTRSYFMFMM